MSTPSLSVCKSRSLSGAEGQALAQVRPFYAVVGVLTILVGIPKPVPERSRRVGFGTSQTISRRGWCPPLPCRYAKPVPERSRRAGFGTSQAIHAVVGVLTILASMPKPVPSGAEGQALAQVRPFYAVVGVLTFLVGMPKPVPERSRRAGFGTSQTISRRGWCPPLPCRYAKPVPERSRRLGFGISQTILSRGWCPHQPPTFIQLNSKFKEIKELNFNVKTLIFCNYPYIVVMETVKSTAKGKNFSTF